MTREKKDSRKEGWGASPETSGEEWGNALRVEETVRGGERTEKQGFVRRGAMRQGGLVGHNCVDWGAQG